MCPARGYAREQGELRNLSLIRGQARSYNFRLLCKPSGLPEHT